MNMQAADSPMGVRADAFAGAWGDVRRKRCAGCGRDYLPRRGDQGMCSDSCWINSRDRHRPVGNEVLTQVARAMDARHERSIAARARVGRLLAAADTEAAVERYGREARETGELIARMEARSRGEVVRTPAAPNCPSCRNLMQSGSRPATAAEAAEIHRTACVR